MNPKIIYVSRDDLASLRLLLAAMRAPHSISAPLRSELDRAVVLPELPPTVVGLHSTVEIVDLETGETDRYTLTLPEQADAAQGRLSILAPLGTALLGYAEGDTLEWRMPGGLRRLRLQTVSPAAGNLARRQFAAP
ncbi:MAG TPA: GreA/GreB family elongation factor [Opitutaceae bacterium]|jgi:regulator of nucleoside diphosphate kinase|nr:GreA/GreB family elongation factor [Opitutaceae bacterium]